MKHVVICCGMIALIFLSLSCLMTPAGGEGWKVVSEGLLLGEFWPAGRSSVGEYPIAVLRVDPSRQSFRLLSALENGEKPRTTREWCEEFGLSAATNAGMYKSNLQSTGYVRNYKQVNNPAVNPAFGAFFMFNPKEPGLPRVGWVDSRRDKEWQKHLKQYDTVIQNYRMISNERKVKWPEQDRPHSTAALGMDREGHVLVILSRTPYTPHDLIDILLSLPLRIKEAMYLEGGDDASLSVRRNGWWIEWSGLAEVAFLPPQFAPRIPNVIGVTPR